MSKGTTRRGMTITEFLLARIAEDEAQARYVYQYGSSSPLALFAPPRVLAECAAKRAIIERIPKLSDEFRPDWFTGKSALYILAAVYADHPDYLPEWVL